MTTFLTFADEQEAKTVLADYYVPAIDEQEGYWITAGIGWAMNLLGTVYDADGNPYPGYGINWSGEVPEASLPFVVEIENPVNVFA